MSLPTTTNSAGTLVEAVPTFELTASGGPKPDATAANPLVVDGGNVFDVTPVLDTSIYADGDVLFVPIAVPNFFAAADKGRPVHSLVVLDEDDQGVGFDLLFFSTAVTLGTLNAAPSISDADARSCLGRVSVSAGDYIDLGGCRVADIHSIGLLLKPASGQTSVYVAGITRFGTPTYTASGLKLKIGAL